MPDEDTEITFLLLRYFTAKMSLLNLSAKICGGFHHHYKSGNICGALDTGLNEKDFRRE